MPRPDQPETLSITNNEINTLRIQNISLANKITSLRREKADLLTQRNDYENKSLALETNLFLFKEAWNKHISELKTVRLLQKTSNDKKLELEVEECFSVTSTVLESLSFQQTNEGFKEKLLLMFQAISKIHKDAITSSQKVIESAVDRVAEEIAHNRVSTEEGLSNLSAFQQKLQELTGTVETIHESNSRLNHSSILAELQTAKKRAEKLEEELADVKEFNEVLDRRFKVALRGFIEFDEDLETEKECKVKNNVFDYLVVENIKVNKEAEEDETEEKKLTEDSAATNKDIALLNQTVETLKKDIQNVTDEKLAALALNERLRLEKKNMDEVFFNSKLYTNLISQAQELLKYINLLKSKVNQYEKLIKDLEKARSAELEDVFKKLVEDKDKYIGMIREISINYDNERKKFDQLEADLIKEYDLNVKSNSFIQLLEQNDKKYTNLNQENEVLRAQLKEYNDSLSVANAQVNKLRDEVTTLTQQNQRLRSMIPGEIKWDEVPFRHSKHKEFLNELHNINKKHSLNIKEKVDDLKFYIKSREDKVESMEAKMKNLNNEISQGKKQAEQLIKEVEINSRISGDVEQKYQQLTMQIRSQNESFANLVKEKVSDRTQYEQEKTGLQGKIKADGELVEKLQLQITKLNGKIQALVEAQDAKEELITMQKTVIEESKTVRESLLKKLDEQKNEMTILEESRETLDQAHKDLIRENDNLKKVQKEKNGAASQKLQRLKKMSNEAGFTDEEEVEFLKLENDKFKSMINCSVCGLREKSVVLAKCFHTFCRPCITGTMEARNRRCPVCKNKIGIDDMKTIHWDV